MVAFIVLSVKMKKMNHLLPIYIKKSSLSVFYSIWHATSIHLVPRLFKILMWIKAVWPRWNAVRCRIVDTRPLYCIFNRNWSLSITIEDVVYNNHIYIKSGSDFCVDETWHLISRLITASHIWVHNNIVVFNLFLSAS